MALAAPVEELQPVAARSIIEHLRRGSVPVDQVTYFTVGRERWLSIIEDDLTHYIAAGGAKVRFLNGDYGDGKTHFLSVIQHLVHQAGFAVSFVVLTREVPLHKFELVYREIVSRLSTAAGTTGLRGLLTHWLHSLQPHLGEVPDEATRTARLEALADTLRSMEGMDLNFANGLIALLHNRFRPFKEGETSDAREAERLTLYEWFEGGRLNRSELRQWQIFESLSKTNSKRLLVSLILLLRHLGYQGLIVLLDELETVLLQSASVRNAAY
ncbi:MAG TPA: BREX system ATP-binding domain-containing protein, partial [Candidatus Tectomicrobia bacterium]